MTPALPRVCGTRVRYLHSTYLPSEETCFCVFEAASSDAVRAVNVAANFPIDRITDALVMYEAQPPPANLNQPRSPDERGGKRGLLRLVSSAGVAGVFVAAMTGCGGGSPAGAVKAGVPATSTATAAASASAAGPSSKAAPVKAAPVKATGGGDFCKAIAASINQTSSATGSAQSIAATVARVRTEERQAVSLAPSAIKRDVVLLLAASERSGTLSRRSTTTTPRSLPPTCPRSLTGNGGGREALDRLHDDYVRHQRRFPENPVVPGILVQSSADR